MKYNKYNDSHIVRSIENLSDSISIIWQDGERSSYHNLWLQDSCRCAKCFQADTLSVNHDHLKNIDLNGKLLSAALDVSGNVVVAFYTGNNTTAHTTTFNAAWLRAHADVGNIPIGQQLTHWQRDHVLNVFDWSDEIFFDDDKQLRTLALLKTTGAFIVTNVPTDEQTFVAAVERIGPLRQRYHPSPVFKMDSRNSQAKKIQASYQDDLENHTDHAAYEYPARIQFLHCAEYIGKKEDAINTLCDGFAVAEQLKQQYPEYYRLLSETIIPACRRRFLVEEGDTPHLRRYEWESYHANRVLHHDSNGQLTRISFNHNARAPLPAATKDMPKVYAAYKKFYEMINDPQYNIRLKLNPGDMLVMDNHRLVHGRSSYDSNTTTRLLHGAYLSNEVFQSRWRLLMGAKTALEDKWLTGCSNDVLSNLVNNLAGSSI